MYFFQNLFELAETLDLQLTIKKKNDKLTIAVLPNSFKDIVPVIITGTPTDLDRDFIEAIRAPLIAAASLVVEKAQHEESVEKATSKIATKPTTDKKKSKAEMTGKVAKTEKKTEEKKEDSLFDSFASDIPPAADAPVDEEEAQDEPEESEEATDQSEVAADEETE